MGGQFKKIKTQSPPARNAISTNVENRAKSEKDIMKPIRIHNHPAMEKELNVPIGHVIIDEELFYELLRRFGICLPDDVETSSPIRDEPTPTTAG